MVFASKTNNLAATPSDKGYIHWKFYDKMSRTDVQNILKFYKGKNRGVLINTGGHGNADGSGPETEGNGSG